MAGSGTSAIGLINLDMKETGKPSAGNLHAGFDVAGAGNQLTVWLMRHSQRKRRATDRPNLRSVAPVLDPTLEGWTGASPSGYSVYRDYTEAQCSVRTWRLQALGILTLEPERLKNRSTTTRERIAGDGKRFSPETLKRLATSVSRCRSFLLSSITLG